MTTPATTPTTGRMFAAFAALALAAAALVPAAARAEDEQRLQQLVERARFTLEQFDADPDLQQFRDYVPYAHALLIVPAYMKGAYFLGGAGGRGVLIKRDAATGRWSSPAFYRLWSLSLGLQVGGSASELLVIFQTEEGLALLDDTSLKFGLDAAVAAGPMGYGVEGSTSTAGSRDIAAFSRVKGAFMGASMAGTSMVLRDDWNATYYGRPVSVTEILSGQVRNPNADGLSRAAAAFFNNNSGRSN